MSITQTSVLIQPTTPLIKAWAGCYDEGWGNLITPAAFSHPAKYSFGLVKRIYEYMLAQGYVKPGDVILDPFGGIGNGAIANFYGLNWLGNELEKKFHNMGAGCECTGISPEQWTRLSEQFKPDSIGQLNYQDGHLWCPACIAGALQIASGDILDKPGQPGLFDQSEDSRLPANFRLNENGTPYTSPHHYVGNLELFRKYSQPGTFAILLQGDSRYLGQVIAQAQVSGLLSSPPYANGEKGHPSLGSVNKDGWGQDGRDIAGRRGVDGNYGATSGQLANMPQGSVDGLLSSPPYVNSVNQQGSANDTEARIERMKQAGIDVTNRVNVGGANGVARQPQQYGDSDGQIGAMKEGNLDALLTSPPFAGNTGGRGEASRNGIDAALFDRHSGGMKRGTGENPDNLDHLPLKGLDAVLGSPPYEGSLTAGGNLHNLATATSINDPGGRGRRRGGGVEQVYGNHPDQLGNTEGQTFWQAAKQIVDECYHLLKPGSYTAWVVKDFVRDGQRVEFTRQWQRLCEACGFEYVESIRAMLVTDNGVQGGLNGEDKRLRKERKSFFRRLHESRLTEDQDHLRIDWEEVLILRKPL